MTKILVIEDDSAVRTNLLELLDAEYFAVMGAEDGREGLQLARDYLPDLIICDILMPELDGYSVLEQLRQDPRTDTIPFVFLSAMRELADLRQGMDLGADDYLTKPFTRDQLLSAIAARLERRAYVRTHFEERLDELRHGIAASMPHEFLTPLTIIMAAAEIFMRHPDKLEPGEISEVGRRIHTSAERLQRLIKNYLLYANLELAGSNAERAATVRGSEASDAQAVISEAALRVAREAGRATDLSLELNEATLRISAVNLRKIVEELLDNAFRYSEPGTAVVVHNHMRPASACILSVVDHGRGMTSEQVARVGAYVQFERNRYEQQGQGLGLAIVKRLAELHGGGFTIESVPGRQTIVSVALPAQPSLEGVSRP
jgi:two-component system sensor histidine kinase/response regulator